MTDVLVPPRRSMTEAEIVARERSIPAAFDDIARRCPDGTALGGAEPMTYRELARAADQVAGGVRARTGEAAEPVGLLFTHFPSFLAALLGVLKAGKIAMPLDRSYPVASLEANLADSGARLLLGDGPPLGDREVTPLEDLRESHDAMADCLISPDAPAMLLYTSGSTGEPKGILTRHRTHVSPAVIQMQPQGPGDRVGSLMNLAFAAAYVGIFSALLSGATLFRYTLDESSLVDLPASLTRDAITVTVLLNSVLRSVAATAGPGGVPCIPSIRQLMFGGESVTAEDAASARALCPADATVVHGYGSSEAPSICWHVVDRSESPHERVPIGLGAPAATVRLIDVEDGVGEVAVSDRSLALGYWDRDEATARTFSVDPDTGEPSYRTGDLGRLDAAGRLVLAGRRDRVVKINGKRVELDGVEHALRSVEHVVDAAAIARRRASGAHVLMGFIVTENKATTPKTIRHSLEIAVPPHMVPSRIIMLDALPRLPNGKAHMRALAEIEIPPGAPPRNDLERRLMEIWREILDVPVGVDDDFFELGGDSLAVAELLVTVEEAFGRPVGLPDILAAPSAELFALWLERQGGSICRTDVQDLERREEAVAEAIRSVTLDGESMSA
jgi:acyl-coenzyme A synthetase/AMP-(fatty) acid ligase